MRIALLLLGIVLAGCAGRQQVIAVHPDKEPVCGFVEPWKHCCVLGDGPRLLVQCEDFEMKRGPPPKPDNPPRDA